MSASFLALPLLVSFRAGVWFLGWMKADVYSMCATLKNLTSCGNETLKILDAAIKAEAEKRPTAIEMFEQFERLKKLLKQKP